MMDETLAVLMNTDFRLQSNCFPSIVMLFTGCIVMDKTSLLLLTCELYSRYMSLDSHTESGVDTLPTAASKCPGISCMIIMSSNGKKVRKELIIDLSMMNLLVTCCAMIAPDCSEVNTGPQTNVDPTAIKSESAALFLRTDTVEKFKSAMLTDANIMPRNPSCLRQLSSGFEHFSTYVFLRKTLDASTTHDVCPQQSHLVQ